jgi:CheY-like chemotaxis protein
MPINGTKLILIGEDDVDDQEFLKEIFNTVDPTFELVFLNNGRDVVAHVGKLRDSFPCLILLDYNMPGLNGSEILEELQKLPSTHAIPKVIWSTSGSSTFRNLCLQAGATDYVIKPSNVNDLKKIVEYMVSIC